MALAYSLADLNPSEYTRRVVINDRPPQTINQHLSGIIDRRQAASVGMPGRPLVVNETPPAFAPIEVRGRVEQTFQV